MKILEKIKDLNYFNQNFKLKSILVDLEEYLRKAPNYATTTLAIADVLLLSGSVYTVGVTKQLYLK